MQVDVFNSEQKPPEFFAPAGLANVLALELDDGTTITESVAMCRYFESVYPEPNMFGRDPRETAVIEMWTRHVEMVVATPLMLAERRSHPAFAAPGTQVAASAEVNLTCATRAIEMPDRPYRESRYIAACRVTIADITAFEAMDFGRMIKSAPLATLINVTGWTDEMRA